MKKKFDPILLILLFIILNWCTKAIAHLFASEMVGTSVVYSLDSIIYGVLMVSIQIHFPVFVKKHSKRLCCLGLFIFVLALLLYLKGTLSLYPFFNTISALSLALILPYSESVCVKNHSIAQLITTLSKASYTIYLSNFLMVVFFTENFLIHIIPIDTPLTAFLVFSIYMTTSIIFSYVHYRAFEVPMMNLRDKSWIKSYFEKDFIVTLPDKISSTELLPEALPLREHDFKKN
jgi:peptidoglycan/LPS O-acetylase OafA/YrhL